MEKVLDDFGLVKGGGVIGSFGGLFDIPWLARINAFEDAQPAEIWESDLQFPHGLSSGDVVLRLAGCSFLLYFRHCDNMQAKAAHNNFRTRNFFLAEKVNYVVNFTSFLKGRCAEKNAQASPHLSSAEISHRGCHIEPGPSGKCAASCTAVYRSPRIECFFGFSTSQFRFRSICGIRAGTGGLKIGNY